VVYWFGFVDDVKLEVPKGISMVDQRFFERDDVVPLPQTVKRVGSS
jgi:hypothetical protein